MGGIYDFFRDSLNDNDHFGYISLDEPKQASRDEIILERR